MRKETGSIVLATSRGTYTMNLVGVPDFLPDAILMTLSIEKSDGLEKVALKCRIDAAVLGEISNIPPAIESIARWIERDFDHVREAALKSVRSERKIYELSFDGSNPGPFENK